MLRFRSLSCALVLVALGLLAGPLVAAADESSKTPAEILADVQRDLAKVRTYHLSGSEVQGNVTTRLTADVSAGGRADVTTREGARSARVIVLPGATYAKANAAFWKAHLPPQAAKLAPRLAGRWLKTTDPSLRMLAAPLLPKRLAACTTVGNGTLTNGGMGSVGGRPAVVLVDAGDQPGTTPGRLYVTTTPPILPLRAVQTGPRQPGGQLDPLCQDSSDTSTASDLRFSHFDRHLQIRAPRGAVKVPSAG
jgi:hypothetical protein